MDAALIRSKLNTRSLGGELLLFPELDSTNSYLKREAGHLPHGTVVLAGRQTGGRGRRGRSFASPEGQGIYCSVLLRPNVPPIQALDLTSYAAVALCDGVERASGQRPGIKWTNDLVLGGKKICGILCEMGFTRAGGLGYVVAGFGLNVAQRPEDWPEELRPIAGSLFEAAGRLYPLEEVAAACLNALDLWYLAWEAGCREDCLAQYRKDCLTLGREVRLVKGGEERLAFAEEIGGDFSLIVRWPDGRREAVTSGEVSVRGLYGYL